jgi:hypothetical protein
VRADPDPAGGEPLQQPLVHELAGEAVGGRQGEVRTIGELRQGQLRTFGARDGVEHSDGTTEYRPVALFGFGVQG